ncbi:MAG: hypothetical protein Q8877_02805, partial [Sweet potato little leaf phytoplasma]|nr:hypothetical protein [Sweet potato little leaf phytoplasma]
MTDTICPLCGEDKETIVHALLQSRFALQTWFASPLALRVDQFNVAFKTQLQELVQTRHQHIKYKIVAETGLAHEKEFIAEVYLSE